MLVNKVHSGLECMRRGEGRRRRIEEEEEEEEEGKEEEREVTKHDNFSTFAA